MADKLNYQDLIGNVDQFVSITDGVANIDNKEIQEACFHQLGTTLADVKRAYDSTAVIENAIAHVFSEKAQDYMKAHKDVDSIVAKTKIGEEAVTFTSRRDSQTRNPQTGEIKDVKGALKVTRTLNNRSSELTDIKTLAKERGFKHL